jgi:hypothetical protein
VEHACFDELLVEVDHRRQWLQMANPGSRFTAAPLRLLGAPEHICEHVMHDKQSFKIEAVR